MYNFSSKNANYGTLSISRFGGVDFATAPLNMSLSRSPDSVNMMPCGNGSVECRHGYEVIANADGQINGIFTLALDSGDRILVHHGTYISEWQDDGTLKELYSFAPNQKSSCQQMGNKLYIFTGYKALVYGALDVKDENGNVTGTAFEVRKLEDEAYIPTTYIGRSPSKYVNNSVIKGGGGGTAFEPVNLLSKKRIETFVVSSEDSENGYETLVMSVSPISSIDKIETLLDDGTWYEIGTDNYWVTEEEGYVRVMDWQNSSNIFCLRPTPITGYDNYRVTYTVDYSGTFEDKRVRFDFRNQEAFSTFYPNDSWETNFPDYAVEWNRVFLGNTFDLDVLEAGMTITFRSLINSIADDEIESKFRFYKEDGTSVDYQELTITIDDFSEDNHLITDTDGNMLYMYTDDTGSEGFCSASVKTRVRNMTDGYWLYISDVYGSSTEPLNARKRPISTGYVSFCTRKDEYTDRINKATISTKFGYAGNLDRIFVAGWNNLQEYEFWSDFENPTYFPDLNYAYCGDKDTAIMGWSRIDNNQIAVHKSSNGQDPTIYVQTATMDDDGNINFPLTEGATGVGVVSQRAFAVLDGEPLALSSDGVFATKLVSDIPTDTKYASPRSYYINPKLKECQLADAEAVSFKNKYYLAVDSKVFVADGSQKYLVGGSNDDEVSYEWYFWENVPARIWWIYNGELYFGTSDGRICKFNDSYMDIDKPVKCYWTTPWLDFGTSAYYKKVKNVVVTVLPPDTDFSEVSVEYITAKGSKLVKSFLIDNTSHLPAVRSVATNFKQKKVPAMQIRVKADNAEHFGLVDLSVLYAVSGKFKR